MTVTVRGVRALLAPGTIIGRPAGIASGAAQVMTLAELGGALVTAGHVIGPATQAVPVTVLGTAPISVSTSAGTATVSLGTIANLDILANISGSTAAPVANTLSAWFIAVFGSAEGSIPIQGSSGWTRTNGTTSAGEVLGITTAGNTGNWQTMSAMLDVAGGSFNTQGVVPFRGASFWTALTAGTAGQLLQTRGTGANPVWSTLTAGTGISVAQASGTNTITNTGVTSAVAGTGISVSASTGAVTVALTSPIPSTVGIAGVTDGSSASAGQVGEVLSASVSTGSISISDGSVMSIVSLVLTAGDWDLEGSVIFGMSSTFTGTVISLGLSQSSTSFPSFPANGVNEIIGNFAYSLAENVIVMPTGGLQGVSVSTSTTMYLIVYCVFSAGTLSAGGIITARRRR